MSSKKGKEKKQFCKMFLSFSIKERYQLKCTYQVTMYKVRTFNLSFSQLVNRVWFIWSANFIMH